MKIELQVFIFLWNLYCPRDYRFDRRVLIRSGSPKPRLYTYFIIRNVCIICTDNYSFNNNISHFVFLTRSRIPFVIVTKADLQGSKLFPTKCYDIYYFMWNCLAGHYNGTSLPSQLTKTGFV